MMRHPGNDEPAKAIWDSFLDSRFRGNDILGKITLNERLNITT